MLAEILPKVIKQNEVVVALADRIQHLQKECRMSFSSGRYFQFIHLAVVYLLLHELPVKVAPPGRLAEPHHQVECKVQAGDHC